MENDAPFEIIAAPAKIWIAPVGTAFPVIDVVPNQDWTLLGKAGDKNISEDGVTISHPQSVEVLRALGVRARARRAHGARCRPPLARPRANL